MKHRVPIHAYRLVYPDSPHAPDMLWEWDKPHIGRLLWNAMTFGRTVVQCSFVDWDACTQANQRIWEAYYLLRPLYEPWGTWRAWVTEYRTLVATVQEVYKAQYGQKHEDQQ